MIVKCEKCQTIYNDEELLTYCPHDSIYGNLCRKHDLFSCFICQEEKDKRRIEDAEKFGDK